MRGRAGPSPRPLPHPEESILRDPDDFDDFDDNTDVYSAADDDIFDRADHDRKARKENPDE